MTEDEKHEEQAVGQPVTPDNALTSGDPSHQAPASASDQGGQQGSLPPESQPSGQWTPPPQTAHTPPPQQPQFVQPHSGPTFVPPQPSQQPGQFSQAGFSDPQPGPAFAQDPSKKPSNWQAITALACGVTSLILVFISVGLLSPFSLIFAIAAVVFGILGKRRVDRGDFVGQRGLAVAGLVTGSIGLVISVLAIAGWIALILTGALNSPDKSNSGDVLIGAIKLVFSVLS